ncbi:hypothetical protein JCM9534A_14810 [Catenuloplanes indicus JCM 9534]
MLSGGLSMTAAAHSVVRAGDARYTAAAMDSSAGDVTAAVAHAATDYGSVLSDLAYSLASQTDLYRNDFLRITAGLTNVRLHGATRIGYVVPATSAQIPDVQRRWRGYGADGLTPRPAAGTDVHSFVIYDKVFDGHPNQQGVDLAGNPAAAEVLRHARNRRALAISPAFQPALDNETATGSRRTFVMLAAPVFSFADSADAFRGWAVMMLRTQDFLAQTLLDRGANAVQARVVDPAAGLELASVAPGRRATGTALDRRHELTVGGRRWQISMTPTTRLVSDASGGLSGLTLASGAALTVMLAAMTGILAGSRGRALDQVDRATTALRLDIARRQQIEAQLREREQELQHLAFHDPLTGLANRLLFYDRLTHALHTHAREGRTFAVLFIDLDGFKEINDRHGHQAGDTVLRTVADRLREGLRVADTVARFGGDEYAIILESLTGADDARVAAERVIAEVQAPIALKDGTAVGVSASVGIAVNQPGASADDIIRDADTAMYTAKTAGKNRFAF